MLPLPWAVLPARSPHLSARCIPVEGLHLSGRLLSYDFSSVPNPCDSAGQPLHTAVIIYFVFVVIEVNYTHFIFVLTSFPKGN